MRRAALLIATMMLSLLLAAGAALASTIIDTTPQWDGQRVVWPFGHPDTATYGQIITAPANDTQLDSFTFLMNVPNTVVFRGEVYAWDGGKATGPNLYESAPRTTSGSNSFEEITFDTGGVQLEPGQQYVSFATISKDYEVSSGSGEWAAVFSGDAYPGGHFVFMNNGPSFDQLFTAAWDHFERGDHAFWDLAFRAVFSSPASPTPQTKEECKKGGWKNFENPDGSQMFKNQGDCVSFVASKGKNEPIG